MKIPTFFMPLIDTVSCQHLTFIPVVTCRLRSLLGFIFIFPPGRTIISTSIPPPSLCKVFYNLYRGFPFLGYFPESHQAGLFLLPLAVVLQLRRWLSAEDPARLSLRGRPASQKGFKGEAERWPFSNGSALNDNTSLISMLSYISSAAYSAKALKWG